MKHTDGMCVSTRAAYLLPVGMCRQSPEGFKEYYHGPQDIPPEHRIFAYPEKAEPVHSILATLKQFSRSPTRSEKGQGGAFP